ncbi:hypothetical protein HCH_04295 [Hahella chejuensis KCTC 2396]|uniref:Uncharacterized protein n=1 Tax=Hahella chejuensis (strain KCTC 2396) TaxID=349521 RepID=Q2SEC2_HAHCH|nr:hypothetical protein HCH_04295 [Hahella chejuensis KCTC 2396]
MSPLSPSKRTEGCGSKLHPDLMSINYQQLKGQIGRGEVRRLRRVALEQLLEERAHVNKVSAITKSRFRNILLTLVVSCCVAGGVAGFYFILR